MKAEPVVEDLVGGVEIAKDSDSEIVNKGVKNLVGNSDDVFGEKKFLELKILRKLVMVAW